jgi:eukaryotic-like serine/threonine-protein kinase
VTERAAASAWDIETSNGSLCCGNGGNGYAFLAAYRLSGARLWLDRARIAARRAARDRSTFGFRDSLYKGALGAALLASELDRPAMAAMPLFEPVRLNDRVST